MKLNPLQEIKENQSCKNVSAFIVKRFVPCLGFFLMLRNICEQPKQF